MAARCAVPDKSADPADNERIDDIFAARVRATEAQVHELVGRGLDYGDRPHFGDAHEGKGQLDLFLTRDQIEALRGEGYEVEIASNQSARQRERLAEVEQGDRYEAGRIPPKGLGRKIHGRGQPGETPPRLQDHDDGPEPRP
jgi:hypothetical protein